MDLNDPFILNCVFGDGAGDLVFTMVFFKLSKKFLFLIYRVSNLPIPDVIIIMHQSNNR